MLIENHLKNTDTERNAKAADSDTYWGKEHLRCAELRCGNVVKFSSKVVGSVVTLDEHGRSDTQVNFKKVI